MRDFYFTCCFLITTAFINAQITLTNTTSVPTVGSSFTYHNVTTIPLEVDVSQTGANQTWDLSLLNADGGDSTISWVDASGTLDAVNFPNATLALQNNLDSSVSYMSSSATDFSFEGFYFENEFRTTFSDKRELLKFPITYNDAFNETFSSSSEYFTDNTLGSASGTIEIIADGYGTLVLPPFTTINDVLKVKVTESYTSQVIDGVSLPDVTVISNYWFNAYTKLFIAVINEQIIDGDSEFSASYISQSDLVLGIDDLDSSTKVSIYPNPSNDYFVLKNQLNHRFSAHLYDVKGLLVKSFDVFDGENSINVKDLNSGIYLLKFQSNFKNYIKKLVVK